MPNWCENRLQVTGDAELVKQFQVSVRDKDTDLSLNKLVPMPKELEGTPSPNEKPNWYNWCYSNWGTKWDVYARLVDEMEGQIVYEFDSAGSPPVNWIENVARQYPTLQFVLHYQEDGSGYAGVAVGENGEVDDEMFTC